MKLTPFDLNNDSITEFLENGSGELMEAYMKMIERSFYVSDAGISRKMLNDWDSQGLVPFPKNYTGWTKFSLFEIVWLRCVKELRSFGVSIDRIKIVKDLFFDVDTKEWRDLTISAFERSDMKIPWKDEMLEIWKDEKISKDLWQTVIQDTQMTWMAFFVLEVLISNHNLCFTIDEKNSIEIISLGAASDERAKSDTTALPRLLDTSFVLINVRKIVRSFFADNSIRITNDLIISFLNTKERKIIEKIRKGRIKEITIRFDKNSEPTHVETTEVKDTEAEINKIARLLKKGEYSTITMKTADGKLLNFEKKDIEKL